jgi:hypothetical protein
MSENTLTSELNKQICEANGCFAIAEQEIIVPVGQIGKIVLSVCSGCKPKFIVNRTLEQKAAEV